MTPRLRASVRSFVRTYCARFVQLLPINLSSANRYDGVDGQESDGDEPEPQRTIERMQHYGFRSRPRATSRAVVLQVNGGAGNNVSVAEETPGTGPTDQKDGEVEVYSEYGQRIRYLQDQNLRVDAPGVADVIINGGSAKVARVGDKGFYGELIAYHDLDTSVTPPVLTVRLSYRSNDPASPYYFTEKKLLEFKVPGATPVTPPDKNEEKVDIRGRNETGADRFKA